MAAAARPHAVIECAQRALGDSRAPVIWQESHASTIVLAGARRTERTSSSLPTPVPPRIDYKFPSGAGLLFFYVKPDKTADFEAVVARLSEVLDKTEDPVRKPQAANWHILRSVEATPTPRSTCSCSSRPSRAPTTIPVKMLGEALPTEAQALYEQLRDSVIRVERMGLGKIR